MAKNIHSDQNGKDTESFSVLLVEDSHPQGLRFKRALENIGCYVEWAETGLDGLALAHHKDFDLIVLDIELPDTNGFEICKKLKANSDLAEIPVIMLTSLDQAENALSGLTAGALDYIPKDTFAEMVLIGTIKQMKKKRHLA